MKIKHTIIGSIVFRTTHFQDGTAEWNKSEYFFLFRSISELDIASCTEVKYSENLTRGIHVQ